MYSGDEHYGDDVTSPLYRPHANAANGAWYVTEDDTGLAIEWLTDAEIAMGYCNVRRGPFDTETEAEGCLDEMEGGDDPAPEGLARIPGRAWVD